MTNDFNRPNPDLRTTPIRDRSPWTMWASVAAAIVVLALAWSYWPRTSAPPVTAPAETSTTQPPATTTAPATPPATTTAPATPAPAPAPAPAQ
ncbi:hypothetical protein CPY51_12565 [Rhizobium tubonense]|uniref:Uncharacterized protein n=1 Tax=Rhizobium tubonense TaxID=484088 RepID=A0A2W4ERN8_9HYPH|nr:hypothetical protein CPY51_12565 [Rhizobium tubonense]